MIWNSGFIPQPTLTFAAAVDADGGPVWWNTPITEAIQRKADGEGSKNAKGKRPAEDEIDPEVRKRLAALKGEMAAGAGDAPGDLD